MKTINITVNPQEEGFLLTMQKADTSSIQQYQGPCGAVRTVTVAVTSQAEAIERIRQELSNNE